MLGLCTMVPQVRTSAMAPRTEWLAAAMLGDTYAPMARMADDVPPGAPTVDSAGPVGTL